MEHIFFCEVKKMKYRAIIKKKEDWWIGWMLDIPGVNAQEKTKEELIESLKIGAEDMLKTEIPFIPGAEMATINLDDDIFLTH